MKIAVSGVHSTGKTTFITNLTSMLDDRKLDYSIVDSVASKCPLPKLRDQTLDATLWITLRGMSEEIEKAALNDIILVDRSVVDPWVYFISNVDNAEIPVNDNKARIIKSIITNWISSYDIIYKTEINETIPINDDGTRDIDINYRKSVASNVEKIFNEYNIAYRPLTSDNSDEELGWLINLISTTK